MLSSNIVIAKTSVNGTKVFPNFVSKIRFQNSSFREKV